MANNYTSSSIEVIAIINATIDLEKGYTNDPDDAGGETNFGITKSVARAYGYKGEMRDMLREVAIQIYKRRYWHDPGLDAIAKYGRIAVRVFDFGALAGQATSIKILQRCLNVLNRREKDYPDIIVDGRLGILTANALHAFAGKRGDEGLKVIVGMITALQSAYLIECAENKESNEKYLYGWQLNRAIGTIM